MDGNVKAFQEALQNWLHKNEMPEVQIDFCTDFAFDDETHTIYVGVQQYENVDEFYEEFLDINGCEWGNIPGPVLAFLHELGHANTLKHFNIEQLAFFQFAKKMIDQNDEKKAMFDYWEVPDEWAANDWAIHFINEHIDAVQELIAAYADAWNKLVEAVDVFSIAKSFEEVY